MQIKYNLSDKENKHISILNWPMELKYFEENKLALKTDVIVEFMRNIPMPCYNKYNLRFRHVLKHGKDGNYYTCSQELPK